MTPRAAIRVVGDPVFVRVLASKITRAARRAERRSDERVSKADPFARDTLDARNFDERIINFVPAQIVNEDEDDVRGTIESAADTVSDRSTAAKNVKT